MEWRLCEYTVQHISKDPCSSFTHRGDPVRGLSSDVGGGVALVTEQVEGLNLCSGSAAVGDILFRANVSGWQFTTKTDKSQARIGHSENLSQSGCYTPAERTFGEAEKLSLEPPEQFGLDISSSSTTIETQL